ncbi:MAG: hypothetical protein M1839_004260 [Geoglossum umbratile]|nr:MAG: hypothetical protein M1839_004260 [Geoglossum umbratile]
MSSERQAKRPYQANITSYFSSIQPASTLPSRSTLAQCTPPLPAAIQSSLLNVGMRIRKSVPEGYKTGSYYAPGLVADDSASPYATARKITSQNVSDRHLTELTPYCGIMKVGGYALQRDEGDRRLISPEYETNDALCRDQFDFPGGSQDSTTSILSTDSMPVAPQTVNPQKRRLEDESEYEIGEMSLSPFIYEDLAPPPVSLPNYPVSGISTRSINLSRPLARPRSCRGARQITNLRNAKSHIGNEENVDVVVGDTQTAQDGCDFGEADFLLLHSWATAEVEMTGI